MATDLSVHFQLVDETKKYVARLSEGAPEALEGASDEAWESRLKDVFVDFPDHLFLCKIFLHAADLSNPVRPFKYVRC